MLHEFMHLPTPVRAELSQKGDKVVGRTDYNALNCLSMTTNARLPFMVVTRISGKSCSGGMGCSRTGQRLSQSGCQGLRNFLFHSPSALNRAKTTIKLSKTAVSPMHTNELNQTHSMSQRLFRAYCSAKFRLLVPKLSAH